MKSKSLAIKVESIPPLKSTATFVSGVLPSWMIDLVIYFNDSINSFLTLTRMSVSFESDNDFGISDKLLLCIF